MKLRMARATSLCVACGVLALPAGARAVAWLNPQFVSSPTSDVNFSVRGALSASQDTFAVWPQGQAVEVALRPAGGSFAVTELSSSASTGGGTEPDVATDGAGNAVAVWLESDGVHAAVRPAGGAFSVVPGAISRTGAQSPRVAFDSAGNAFVVWSQATANPTKGMYASIRAAGGTFGAPQPAYVAVGTETPSAPLLAADSSGHMAVLFSTEAIDNAGNFTDTVRSVIHGAAGFDPAQQIDTSSGVVGYNGGVRIGPAGIAMDAAGDAAAAISASSLSGSPGSTTLGSAVKLAIRPVGSPSWSTPVQKDSASQAEDPTPHGSTVDGVAVSYDSAGEAIAAWRRQDSVNGNAIKVAVAAPEASSFGSPVPVTTGDVGVPQLAPEAAGTELLAEPDSTGVRAFERPQGGAFGPLLTVAPNNPSTFTSALASDPAGDAVFAWLHTDPSSGHARVDTVTRDATPPAITDVAVPAAGTVGQPLAFSANVTDAFSQVTTGWSFGDGSTANGASASHTYGSPGSFTATLTASDGAGNTAAPVTRGVGVAFPAPPPPGTPQVLRFAVAPSKFAVGPRPTPVARLARKRRPPKGTKLRYKLSEAGTVKITFARATRGRRSGRRCVKPTAALRHKRACTRFVAKGSLTRHGSAGSNTTSFTGRIGRKALAPGRYRAVIKETTPGAPAQSAPRQARFTVVRG